MGKYLEKLRNTKYDTLKNDLFSGTEIDYNFLLI